MKIERLNLYHLKPKGCLRTSKYRGVIRSLSKLTDKELVMRSKYLNTKRASIELQGSFYPVNSIVRGLLYSDSGKKKIVLQTATGRLVEDTKVCGRIILKELGKLIL